jgi:hypothetical protein
LGSISGSQPTSQTTSHPRSSVLQQHQEAEQAQHGADWVRQEAEAEAELEHVRQQEEMLMGKCNVRMCLRIFLAARA